MYAIVKTGGKQYRVEEGRAVTVERLPAQEGDRLELGDVLLIADGSNVLVGTPAIEGARVVAEVEAQGRDKKIVVFKYKAKVRTRKKTGHRQPFTRLLIQEILRPGDKAKASKRTARSADTEGAEEAAPDKPTSSAKTSRKAAAATSPAAPPKRRSSRKPEATAKESGPAQGAAKPKPAKDEAKKRSRRPTAKKDE
jgi:large subunit ribosomal protein L21